MVEVLIAVAGALAFLAALMFVGWVFQARVGDAGWSDVFWSFGVGAAGSALAITPFEALPAAPARRAIVGALCAAWGLRLGGHIAARMTHGAEDARYATMRRELGSRFQRTMLGFMLVQAPIGAILALAVLIAAHAPEPLGRYDLAALAVLAVAIAVDGLADRQLARFKARPENRGRVCDEGLWAWSRHPNYVFEWLIWTAYPLAAFAFGPGRPWPWLALAAPGMMYWLLTRVSGVPPLERAMLASRGEAYRAYQARVPAFFPFAKPGARA